MNIELGFVGFANTCISFSWNSKHFISLCDEIPERFLFIQNFLRTYVAGKVFRMQINSFSSSCNYVLFRPSFFVLTRLR